MQQENPPAYNTRQRTLSGYKNMRPNMAETSEVENAKKNRQAYVQKWLQTSKNIGKRMLRAGLKEGSKYDECNEDNEVSLNLEKSAILNKQRRLSSRKPLRIKDVLNSNLHKQTELSEIKGRSVVDNEAKEVNMDKRKERILGKTYGLVNRAECSQSGEKWSDVEAYSENRFEWEQQSVQSDWIGQQQLKGDEFKFGQQIVSAPGSISSSLEERQVEETENESEDAQGSQDGTDVQEEIERENSKSQEESRKDEEGERLIAEYRTRLQEKDTTVVFDLFELLLTKMTAVQNSIEEVRKQQSILDRKILKIESSVIQTKSECAELAENSEEVSETMMYLIQTAISHDNKISVAQSQLEKTKRQIVKGSFVVKGIKEADKDDPIGSITSFIENKLEIGGEVPIMSAHRIGKGKNRPIWFKLTDNDDVRVIYSHLKNLKGKTNSENEKFVVTEQLTEAEREEKSRNQDILMDNRRTPASHQLTIAREHGNLVINGEQYRKQVEPPQVKEVLLLTKEEGQALDQYGIHQGAYRSHNGSQFYSYSAKVKDFDEVKKLYVKLRRDHLNATHVMCGYRLFHALAPLYQDYSNDGEEGGGRRILDALKSAGVFNMCVFVVRYHEGPNIGVKRFEIITELSKDVISSFPGPLDYGATCGRSDPDLLQGLKQAATKKTKASGKKSNPNRGEMHGGRGQARGRGNRGSRGTRGDPPGRGRNKNPT